MGAGGGGGAAATDGGAVGGSGAAGVADVADHAVALDLEIGPKDAAAELVAHDDVVAGYVELYAHAGEPGVTQRHRHPEDGAGRVQRESSGAARALLDEVGRRVIGARDAHDVPPPRPAPPAGEVQVRPGAAP